MIRTFPLALQRSIALGLLLFAIIAFISFLMVPGAVALTLSLSRLADMRRTITRLEHVQDTPEAPATPGPSLQSYLLAPDRSSAHKQAVGLLSQIAARSAVRLEIVPSLSGPGSPPSLVVLAFTARGEASAILAFVGQLESGMPVMRYRQIAIRAVTPVVATDGLPAGPAAAPSQIMPQSPNAPVTDIDAAAGASAGANAVAAPQAVRPPLAGGADTNNPGPGSSTAMSGELEVSAILEILWGERS